MVLIIYSYINWTFEKKFAEADASHDGVGHLNWQITTNPAVNTSHMLWHVQVSYHTLFSVVCIFAAL